MNIEGKRRTFTKKSIEKIEKSRSAKFVCETCVKNRYDGWVNAPFAIFYQEDESLIPEGGSNYFGVFFDFDGTPKVCNGISALEPFLGVLDANGNVIYSRYRHDYVKSSDGSTFVDGGRDYLRHGENYGVVELQIRDGELVVVNNFRSV